MAFNWTVNLMLDRRTQYTAMHATTALLPLLALAATVVAAPTPVHEVARGLPNLREVIRNPKPIDAAKDLDEILAALGKDLKGLKGGVHGLLGGVAERAVQSVEDIAVDSIVVVSKWYVDFLHIHLSFPDFHVQISVVYDRTMLAPLVL
jgi:hypothetical protein